MGRTIWRVTVPLFAWETNPITLYATDGSYYVMHSLQNLQGADPKYFWTALTAIVQDMQLELRTVSATVRYA